MNHVQDPNGHQQLLLKIREGNEDAFRKLVGEYIAFANYAALCIFPDKAMAADIAQEAFVRLWNDRKKIDGRLLVKTYLSLAIFELGKKRVVA